jgi:hypothetical protein
LIHALFTLRCLNAAAEKAVQKQMRTDKEQHDDRNDLARAQSPPPPPPSQPPPSNDPQSELPLSPNMPATPPLSRRFVPARRTPKKTAKKLIATTPSKKTIALVMFHTSLSVLALDHILLGCAKF